MNFFAPVPFLHVYWAFASGYLLSYLLRTVNAVISPELTHDLGLTSGSLGLLTSAYFVAFGAMQLPAGMLLDRYGPRRVEPVLLLIAGVGTLWFAMAESVSSLLAARALIGAGVAVCLMAPMKAIAAWYPAERQASLSGWVMVAGGRGRIGGDGAARVRAALHELAVDLRRALDCRVRDRRVDLVAGARHDTSGDERRVRGAMGRRAQGVRRTAILVDRAAGWIRDGLVHGDPGSLVGALADRGQRLRSCDRRASPAGDELRDPCRLRGPGPVRHAARATRHPRPAPVRRRLRALPARRWPPSCCSCRPPTSGGRCTDWARPSTSSPSPSSTTASPGNWRGAPTRRSTC